NYTYDNRNQLTGVEKHQTDGGTLQMRATYVYDVFGNQVEQDVWTSGGSMVVTRFALEGWKNPVDGSGQPYPLVGNENFDVWADVDGSNQLQTRRLFGEGIDQVMARISSSGTAAWYLVDRQRSVRQMIDATGTLSDTITYDGFGNITNETNAAVGDQYK